MLCSRANTSKVEYFFFSSNGGQYLADLGICFQVHADSVQDTLKFNLLRELYVHTYMTKRAFSYIWARTPNLRRIKVSYSTNLYSGRLLRPCQRDNGNYAPQRTHYVTRGLHYADSVQDTLKFNLLRELYMHTYMTKPAFSYIWSMAALRQPSDEARLLLYPVYGSPLAA